MYMLVRAPCRPRLGRRACSVERVCRCPAPTCRAAVWVHPAARLGGALRTATALPPARGGGATVTAWCRPPTGACPPAFCNASPTLSDRNAQVETRLDNKPPMPPCSTQLRSSLRVLSRCLLGRAMEGKSVTTASGSTGEAVQVLCIDPRTVLQSSKLQELLRDEKQFTRLTVPPTFLPQLSQGTMELGDLDDPMNAWHFGARDELFKYRLIGTHATMSGYTSLIEQAQLERLAAAGADAGLPTWPQFQAALQAGSVSFPSPHSPFLFAGAVLDAPAAAVYLLKQGGELVGLAISSEAAE